MYRIYLFIIYFILSANFTFADEFVVKSFKPDVADLSARSNEKKDINGDICAIIKVHSDIQGLKFDANAGITDQVVYKEGAYWIYVSPKERQLKIMKEGFITLPYIIPVNIESSTVYVMVLTNQSKEGKFENNTGFVIINTEPADAEVWINNVYKAQSPYDAEYVVGEYSYKIIKELHYQDSGKFIIEKNKNTDLKIQLKPKFGSLTITSTPESGADIVLDDKKINEKTPYTLTQIASGEHSITLRKEMFKPETKRFSIKEGENMSIKIPMQPLFANVTITAKPDAEIWIDNKKANTITYTSRLSEGVHTIELKKTSYKTEVIKLEIKAGKDTLLTYDLKPINGALSIKTVPSGANIIIEGKNYGLSPQIIPELLIGNYNIQFEKEGYVTISKTIEIKENEKTALIETLSIISDVPSKMNDSLSENIPNVTIGTQVWMLKNLDISTFRNGEIIPETNNQTEWVKAGKEKRPAWCYYNNDPASNEKFGKLYNWFAVNDPRGLAPKGWHIPTEEEWSELTTYLGGMDIAGGKLKEKGTTRWERPNAGTTNESGFTALPGGSCGSNGTFQGIGQFGYWWSSAKVLSAVYVWGRGLNSSNSYLDRYSFNKKIGCSVRCVKDK